MFTCYITYISCIYCVHTMYIYVYICIYMCIYGYIESMCTIYIYGLPTYRLPRAYCLAPIA